MPFPVGSLVLAFVIWVIGHLVVAQAQSLTQTDVVVSSGHSNTVKSLVFSPDGRWLASGSSDSTIKIWDAASGRLLRTLSGHASEVKSVAISRDGRRLASVSQDGTARIWDPATGRALRTISVVEKSDYIRGNIAFFGDGQSILTISQGAIQRWDVDSGSLVQTHPMQGQIAFWHAFALSADARWLAVAHTGAVGAHLKDTGIGSQVKLLDAQSGRIVRVLGTHSKSESVTAITFSPDGRSVVSGGGDGTAKVWEVATGRLLRTLAHSGRLLEALAFSPDGQLIATAGDSEGLQLWDMVTGRLRRSVEAAKYSRAAAFAPDGRSIATTFGGVVTLLDTASGSVLPWSSKSSGLVSISATSDDRWLVVGPAGLAVWDAASGQPVRAYDPQPGYTGGTYQSHFAAKNSVGRSLIATNAGQNTIKLWDMTDGALVRAFEWGPAPRKCAQCTFEPDFRHLAIAEDGRWLAAGFYGGSDAATIKIWDVSSGQLRHSLPQLSEANSTASLASSPDGRWLVVDSLDKNLKHWIKLWDPESGKLLREFVLPKTPDLGSAGGGVLAVSPDARWIATKFDGDDPIRRTYTVYTIALFDLMSGRLVRTFLADRVNNYPTVVKFSPDGALIAVGVGTSQAVNIWHAESGRLVRILEGNFGSPWSIAFSLDGRLVTVGNNNGTSSVWHAHNGDRLVNTVHAESGEWITITPEGFFGASSPKNTASLSIVRGFDIFGFEQVYQALFNPDLVREKLAGDPDQEVMKSAAVMNLDKVLESGPAPTVAVTSHTHGSKSTVDFVSVTARVTELLPVPRTLGLGVMMGLEVAD